MRCNCTKPSKAIPIGDDSNNNLTTISLPSTSTSYEEHCFIIDVLRLMKQKDTIGLFNIIIPFFEYSINFIFEIECKLSIPSTIRLLQVLFKLVYHH